MRRHLIGLIGLAIFVLGLFAPALGWGGESEDREAVFAMLQRIGLQLGVLWLAWPDLVRLTPRLAAGLILGALLLLVVPRQLLVVAVLVFVAWLLARRWLGESPSRSS